MAERHAIMHTGRRTFVAEALSLNPYAETREFRPAETSDPVDPDNPAVHYATKFQAECERCGLHPDFRDHYQVVTIEVEMIEPLIPDPPPIKKPGGA